MHFVSRSVRTPSLGQVPQRMEIVMSVVKSMRFKRLLSFVSMLLFVATGTLMGAGAAHADQAGFTWTSQTGAGTAGTTEWYSVTYGNGLFVAVSDNNGSQGVMTSPDGSTWTLRTTPIGAWVSVTYGNGLFVAVGYADATPGDFNRVMTSSNGIDWTIRTAAATNFWNSVTYGNGLFVAVSGDNRNGEQVMTSSNGIDWTSRTAAAYNEWNAVTFGNGLFVAVSDSVTGSAANRVMTSSNGIDWTARTAANKDWNSVTYGGGLFVAVTGSGPLNTQVMTSPDGSTWTSRTAAAGGGWNSVTYGGGLFVAVSILGHVMTSPDGSTWTGRNAPTADEWYSVTYGGGLFVAVAYYDGSHVMTSGIFGGGASADPAKWTTIPQGLPLSSTGTCDALDDKAVAYGSGLTGGWKRSWEPWVNTTIGANGQRIGGWACIRTLINKGGLTWSIAN